MIVLLTVKQRGVYEAKNGQIWIKLLPLVSCCRKHSTVIGMPGLTAYSENISSLTETLKLFIADDILNEICHHTNAEGSSQIPNFWKGIISEDLFAFWGLCIVSGILMTRKEPVSNLQTANASYALSVVSYNSGKGSVFSDYTCHSF